MSDPHALKPHTREALLCGMPSVTEFQTETGGTYRLTLRHNGYTYDLIGNNDSVANYARVWLQARQLRDIRRIYDRVRRGILAGQITGTGQANALLITQAINANIWHEAE